MDKRKIGFLLAGFSSILFLSYLLFFHYTSQHEVGLVMNKLNGEVYIDTPGIHLTPAWFKVSKIDKRPQRVCISSTSKTVTCKLVVFEKNYFQEFVKREGFRYYWWDNRFSFNSGHSEEYRGIRDVLRGYAFSNAKLKFLKILEEIHE